MQSKQKLISFSSIHLYKAVRIIIYRAGERGKEGREEGRGGWDKEDVGFVRREEREEGMGWGM